MTYFDLWDISSNPNTPPETLELLAQDENSHVRWWVSRNPNTPVEILEILATDRDYNVRSSVTTNPNATEEICLMVRAYLKFNHLVLK
jgi:hypothetical protein